MNLLERKMLDMLKDLRENYNVFGVKAEFEGEGSRLDELMRLQELVVRAGIGITLKIGGAEAIHDMRQGREVGVAEIVAPMIESPFALTKYLKAAHNVYTDDELEDVTLAINVETVTGYGQFAAMLEVPGFSEIGGLSIGRMDLTLSHDLPREEVNSDKIFEVCKDMFGMIKAKNPHVHTVLGGVMGADSVAILDRFAPGLADGYEMRKVMFKTGLPKEKRIQGFIKAAEFEIAWSKNKCDYHLRVAKEDDRYIGRLKGYLEAAQSLV
jgi:hypothetical protein